MNATTATSTTLLDALFEDAHAARCLVAPDGTILRVNAAWLRLTGFTRDVVGEDLLALFPATRDAALAAHAQARAGHRVEVPRHADVVNGRELWWEGSVEPIPMEGATGLLVTARAAPSAEDALRESEERFRTLFQNMTEGFALGEAICDDRGVPRDFRFLEMNAAFERQSGLDRARARGRPMREVLPQLEQSWVDTYCGVALGQPARRFEMYNRDLDREFEVYCFSPARGRFAIIFSDVSARKRALDAVRESEARLREADRRKDEFLGMLSHELRNPLAPIRNAGYVLRHASPGGEQARRAREVIERQTEHLTRLVDDLLDVTRIARGKIELRRSTVDLREVVLRAADDFRLTMEDRGIVFRTQLPDARLLASVDATRVTQVVGNLLHNAAKYTRRGDEVTLTLAVEGGDAVVTVRDTGAGIDPAVLPSVFDPFVQGERTLARTEGGLGLGLALVKGIAELHGGTVRAESEGKGKGSRFAVRLPVQHPPPDPVFRPDAARAAGGGRRVLVVDDNADAADTLADLVRMLGHEAEVAYDGPAALAAVRARRPDVVLCDLGLPGMDGYEVARTVRNEAVEGVRLVAVSGYAQPEDVKRAVEAGFDAHVAKPPDPERIASLLE